MITNWLFVYVIVLITPIGKISNVHCFISRLLFDKDMWRHWQLFLTNLHRHR